MAENSGIMNFNSGESNDPPQFTITETSRKMLNSIEENLAELILRDDLCPSDDEFYNRFCHVLDLYGLLQQEVINASGINVVCRTGCSACCCHWAVDVTSAEAAVISRYLKEHNPDIIDSVIALFRKDAEVLDSLRALVEERMTEYGSDTDENTDSYNMLLSCFYQMERPCALLDDNGCCIVYAVRPFTCRDYLNLRDPEACLPDRINEETEATIIMNLSDKISEQLEILHSRFDLGNDDMSLRSLLADYLVSGTARS